MKELWEKSEQLISLEEWEKEMYSLREKELYSHKEKAKKIIKEKLILAVKQRIPDKKLGIFFSGGVDSSVIAAICKSLNADFICYSVGFQEEGTKIPEDILEAKKVAQKLGFELKYKIFNLKEAEVIIKKVIRILKPVQKTDVINVGVGAVVLAAAELGKKDRINYFFSGLGSEEIFAGYERHEKAHNINQECWKGLKLMWERDLVRDFNLTQALGFTLRTPFLDEELIKEAMKVPGEWKISGKEKKVILREIAQEFLEEFAWRKKKAAQYGSCFDKAISKLAKKQGLKYKKDYLESL